MKTAIVVSLAVLASASGALATISSTGPTYTTRHTGFTPLPQGGNRGTPDGVVPVDVTGIESWDAAGDASNTVVVVDIAAALGHASGTPMVMTGVGWDVTLTGIDPSWLSELRVSFAPDGGPAALFLRPGAGVNNPGTQAFASPVVDLTDIGISNIDLPNGMLSMEFNESFDDANDVIDGLWESGSLSVAARAVPAPASMALLGLGGLVAARRRRA